MKKIAIFLIVLVILIFVILGAIKIFNSDISSEDKIYVNILQNEEKSEELKLNNNNNTNYYYFKIVNYDAENLKYNQTEITPYIKLNFENKTDILTWKLFRLGSIEEVEENWVEITEKGESGTSFEEYYKCDNLLPYEEGKDTNECNYVVKIELDAESEDFINLEEDVNQIFSVVLGYKEVK